jgi:hypothetical protein
LILKTPSPIAKTITINPKTNKKIRLKKPVSRRFRRLDLNATQASEKAILLREIDSLD